MDTRRRRRGAACIAALLVLAAGCAESPGPVAGRRIDVTLRDFVIEPANLTVGPGLTEFTGLNEGPTVHELILVRTELPPDGLPLQADGLTAVEEAPDVEFILADEGIDLGEQGGFAAELRPGPYVLYCNLEGHYLGGMRAGLVVREGTT